MSEELKQQRTERIIKSRITPISNELKTKLNVAFQDVVTRFKDKHLS